MSDSMQAQWVTMHEAISRLSPTPCSRDGNRLPVFENTDSNLLIGFKPIQGPNLITAGVSSSALNYYPDPA